MNLTEKIKNMYQKHIVSVAITEMLVLLTGAYLLGARNEAKKHESDNIVIIIQDEVNEKISRYSIEGQINGEKIKVENIQNLDPKKISIDYLINNQSNIEYNENQNIQRSEKNNLKIKIDAKTIKNEYSIKGYVTNETQIRIE